MKKILFFLICLSNFVFAAQNFEWNWKSSTEIISNKFNNTEKVIEINQPSDTEILVQYFPQDKILKRKFYFYKNKLYKVSIIYNPEKVRLVEVKEIGENLINKYGKIFDTKNIENKNSEIRTTGKKYTWGYEDSIITLEGLDFIDKSNNLINSTLIETYKYIPISSEVNKNN